MIKLTLARKVFLGSGSWGRGVPRPGKRCETWSVNCQYLPGVHLEIASALFQVDLSCLPRTQRRVFLVYKKIILFDNGIPNSVEFSMAFGWSSLFRKSGQQLISESSETWWWSLLDYAVDYSWNLEGGQSHTVSGLSRENIIFGSLLTFDFQKHSRTDLKVYWNHRPKSEHQEGHKTKKLESC